MKKMVVGKVWSVILVMVCILGGLGHQNVYAETKSELVPGSLFEFNEKEHYDYSAIEPTSDITKDNTLGNFSLFGEVSSDGEYNGVPSFTVGDGNVELTYSYSDALLTAPESEWHLVKDNSKKVAELKLDSDIDYGALILQTSKDGNFWVDDVSMTNVFKETPENQESFYTTKSVQLANGCYYRLIVAYKMQRITGQNQILFIKTDEHEDKKVAEVYEFYLHDTNNVINDSTLSRNLGELTKTEKDKGYSGTKEIGIKDPHYGWELGQFFVSGYTRETVDKNDSQKVVFLKNAGDQVTLWFNLKENINILHGDEDLSIADDKDGYDQYFQTEKTDMGRGALLIRYTDEKGVKHEPEIYTNYLEANAKTGADTVVKLFEEGDYEVALDYKIKKTPRKVGNVEVVPEYSDYRIAFTFKIRNGNCMVYPFDIATGSELTDEAITEKGFKLDMAKSRYLTIDVQKSVVTEGVNGYVEDVRFNRPAKDGDEFTEEGIYIFNVKNLYTDESTTKTIYVGSTDYMRALSVNKLTVAELNAQIEQGASIDEDGKLIMSTSTVEETQKSESTEEALTDSSEQSVSETPVSGDTSTVERPADSESSGVPVIPITAGGVVAVGIIVVILSKKKRKNNSDEEAS